MRPLLPKEKDDYTIRWFKSLSKSYITLPIAGIAAIAGSSLLGSFFEEMIRFARSCSLTVAADTEAMFATGKTIGIAIGVILLVKGVLNIVFRDRNDDEDD
ncbi:MAG: hypothetical protein PHP35_01245 [Candidatus Colwellbacteria bacterium]|nr:hypothetical protein [Candidatus Colwellbacteria bacterium]